MAKPNTVTKDLSAGSTDSEGAVYPQGFTYKYDIVTHAEVPSSNEIETNIGEIIGTKQLPLDSPPIERPDSEVNSPASDQDTIAMLLDAESWIEIYDVSGRELYRKLAKPGETLNLSGTAPFSVKLGNAGGVSLRFNGEEFNQAHIRVEALPTLSLEATRFPRLISANIHGHFPQSGPPKRNLKDLISPGSILAYKYQAIRGMYDLLRQRQPNGNLLKKRRLDCLIAMAIRKSVCPFLRKPSYSITP